jgi:hypothetical protein
MKPIAITRLMSPSRRVADALHSQSAPPSHRPDIEGFWGAFGFSLLIHIIVIAREGG